MVRRISTSALALAWLCAVPGAAAQTPAEYEVKAAFLYNFAKFVEWPREILSRPDFVVAVLGTDPFGAVLDDTLAGKTLFERRLVVRRLNGLDEAAGVQILFISSSEKPRLAQILKALEGHSVLTVGDMDGFAARGGMIGFRIEDELIRFDINRDSVNRGRLKMGSQLLRLARIVRRTEG